MVNYQKEERVYSVYILASHLYGTLYIGVTNNLMARVAQHKALEQKGFTKKHHVTRLVWFENFSEIDTAIQREKTMKKWVRAWKINLIERDNPQWIDLSTSNSI
jgi:putative endonuclease